MWKKILQIVSGKDCDLRENMFRTIILAGGLAALVGTAECFVVMEVTSIILPFLIILMLAMCACFVATFKYRKYNFAATVLGIVIIGFVFPAMFFLSGAIEGGASVWWALGILYIFIMFRGRKLVFFLALTIVTYGCTYWYAYANPQLIVWMPTKAAGYIDSYFSVVVVGIVAGVILKSHMRMFEQEHQLNLMQKEELTKNSDTKNVFFANMSHEIRTPINAIIGLNEMILRENPTGETRAYAQDIQVASKMLLNQVNDILDLSQVEMNKMKIIPIQYQTSGLIGDLVELVRVQLEKKQLEFYLDIDRNLPMTLRGDEKRLRQVILNILDNAVKYTEKGSVTLSVHGEEHVNNQILLKIKVADTGIGIRNEDLEHIYDSFNRVDERKNSSITGSGLGLAITKQLVDLMGGEITIDSIYTKGTVFTITIRQDVINETPIGTIDFMHRGDANGNIYQPSFEAPEARILIVDDNSMNSMVATKLLSATKVQVDTAKSGAECLEMTKLKFYNVILLDYMMPIMNGAEALKAIRTQENGLCRESAIIVLTGNALSGARQFYMEQGFDGYVEKPIEGKLLEAEILKFLPSDIIEYLDAASVEAEEQNRIHKITGRKRKKICITTDCACDVPKELLEKYEIKVMYLYIRTPNGRFADTREIDSDSLSQYITAENSSAYADSVTVEEYEEFFADVLTQAERVIHISLGSRAGQSYHIAVKAAKGFDHVHVIDSGQISCGQGLVTLYAAKLAREGRLANEIYEKVEKMKGHVQSAFLMPSSKIYYQNGHISEWVEKICRVFQLHPLITMRQSKPTLIGMFGGDLVAARKRAIRFHLRKRRRINSDIIIITHVGCSVKQQEQLQEEVLRCAPFAKVIVQKASFTNACNSGIGTIGIAYYSYKDANI